jgi:hypothetical protein
VIVSRPDAIPALPRRSAGPRGSAPVVAGIYGMDIKHMPELDSEFGYPIALAAILVARPLVYRILRKNDRL